MLRFKQLLALTAGAGSSDPNNQVTMVQNETVQLFLAVKLGSAEQFHPQQCAEAQGVYLQTISRFKLFYLANP